MSSDYAAIKKENVSRYGTDIGRIGPMLLANRYDDRSHFIFELLQNAEDALNRRPGWQGSHAVSFSLSVKELRVSHFGRPFDDSDVRGICGIAESTKGLTAIGRFGIGFKSVYAFTERPEVHSGEEAFAIDNFVWPTVVSAIERQADETVFVLPLRPGDATAHSDIERGFQRLGPRILLFLRQIEEIAWSVEGGPSGLYLRSKPDDVGKNGRQITLIGEEHGKSDIEETWIVFSREEKTASGDLAGYVEIAFAINNSDEKLNTRSVQAVADSPLVVYFPTVRPTHLGFLIQGPYRTTPSRDNVPPNDLWNQHLIRQTATLMVDALRGLRDQGLMNIGALHCLPLNRARFAEGTMFSPLFNAARDALASEPLLPRFVGGHLPANNAMLARTQELRSLFDPVQLGALLAAEGELDWLSGDISQDRTPELRQYLLDELSVSEITPETILPKLNKVFLEAQSDEWILQLYEFLKGQPALMRQGRLDNIPFIRLESGAHIVSRSSGQLQAFLPSTIQTDFPTVRRAVCATDDARKFLESLGLTEPDPVDDVIRNVLHRYRSEQTQVGDNAYDADIRRILTAFATDSKTRREKLIAALRDTPFVMSVDAGRGSKRRSKPGDVYIATERLKGLFSEVDGVFLVDDSYACLRGEGIRDLLEACGATRYLQPVSVFPNFTWQKLREMRHASGFANYSREEIREDQTLRGLKELLGTLPQLDTEGRKKKTGLLWEALGDVVDRRSTDTFSGTYRWSYYRNSYSVSFDAAFVRQLNETEWVPDSTGELQRPEFLVFDKLGWKTNPFLTSKIRFKPPIIEMLAKEAGIEPGLLDLLKKLGVTSEAELRSRLGIKENVQAEDSGSPEDVADAVTRLLGQTAEPSPPVPGATSPEPSGTGSAGDRSEVSGHGTGAREARTSSAPATDFGHNERRSWSSREGSSKRTPGSHGGRPFISYVGTHQDEEHPDPDGLDQVARMALEEKAIADILARESLLRRTPVRNPGYDLCEVGEDGHPTRWVEVKAMTGGLHDRPVGLSRAQFECAREHGSAFWLYVVEHADGDARVVQIQDPAGKARTFTFDHGWLDVAAVDADRAG